ncbi:MAG: hypothetical protein ACT4OY_06330 [Alphaproteobacteria bacterium]
MFGHGEKKPPADPNKAAKSIIDQLVAKIEGKDPAAVSLGRRGGLKGGKARAEALTPERRSEIARKAVKARWTKAKAAKTKS